MASKVVGNLIVNLAADIADFRSDMRKAAATSQREMRKIEKETRDLKRKMQGAFSAIGTAMAALGVGMAIRGVIRATAEYERLGAALLTVEGSQEKANAKFKELEKFAATTPFQLQEVVDGYIKLKARGLDPSIKSMTAFGNVAGAMGKSLDQFIEAVGDAATGEMERLKEFGIVARQEGDKVRFTFQGVTTEVGRNSREITNYLQGLGETTFAGGMERQADTLGGAISNLEDAFFSLTSSGNVDGLKSSIRDLSDTLNDPAVREGLQTFINGLIKIAEWGVKAASSVADFGKKFGEGMAKAFGHMTLEDQIAHLKTNMRALIRNMGAEAAMGTEQYKEWAEQLLQLQQQLAARGLPVEGPGQSRGARPASEEELRANMPAFDADSYTKWLDSAIAEEAKIRQQEMNEAKKEAARLTESVMTAQERYNKELEHYKLFLNEGLISQETFNRLVAESKERLEESKQGFDIMKAAGEEAGRAIQNAFADFFYDMDGDIKNMAKNFIDAIRQILSQALALQTIKWMFGGTDMGASLFPSLFAPGHAALGGIHSGPTVVGEHGPEVLNLPRGSNVTPNSKLGGENITVNVDARGAMSPGEVVRMVKVGVDEAVNRSLMAQNRGYVPA